ncbi:hypothetical protein ACUH6U_004637, partial [Yersinia enterocolitica]
VPPLILPTASGGRSPSRGLISISAVVPRFVNEQPVVLTGAASGSCLPHRCFVSMGLIYLKDKEW